MVFNEYLLNALIQNYKKIYPLTTVTLVKPSFCCYPRGLFDFTKSVEVPLF